MFGVTAGAGEAAGDAIQRTFGALVIVIQREIGNFFEIFGVEFQALHLASSDV
jgi:hypothetical protein